MSDQSMITTNQLIFNDIDDEEIPQDDEAFEVETSCDDDHLVLCNRHVDFQMRFPLLRHVCLYFFLRIPQSEDDIA